MGGMAIHYQGQGLKVFPLRPGTKEPYKRGSKGHFLFIEAKQRLLSTDEIHEFWSRYPEANIGLYGGEEAGISVLDIDRGGDVDGFETLENVGLGHLQEVGLKIHTPTSNGNQSINHGLDFRNSNKGYSLLPPSSAVPKYEKDGNTFVEYHLHT
jgi:hypothetical protein